MVNNILVSTGAGRKPARKRSAASLFDPFPLVMQVTQHHDPIRR